MVAAAAITGEISDARDIFKDHARRRPQLIGVERKKTKMDLEKITHVTGRGVPVPGDDIDTDRIIPARFMKCVTFDGLGEYAFYDARFNEDGQQQGITLSMRSLIGKPPFWSPAIILAVAVPGSTHPRPFIASASAP
jgi:hypothetical protein